MIVQGQQQGLVCPASRAALNLCVWVRWSVIVRAGVCYLQVLPCASRQNLLTPLPEERQLSLDIRPYVLCPKKVRAGNPGTEHRSQHSCQILECRKLMIALLGYHTHMLPARFIWYSCWYSRHLQCTAVGGASGLHARKQVVFHGGAGSDTTLCLQRAQLERAPPLDFRVRLFCCCPFRVSTWLPQV